MKYIVILNEMYFRFKLNIFPFLKKDISILNEIYFHFK